MIRILRRPHRRLARDSAGQRFNLHAVPLRLPLQLPRCYSGHENINAMVLLFLLLIHACRYREGESIVCAVTPPRF